MEPFNPMVELTNPRYKVLTNFVLFQFGWFACVVGAAHGMAGTGSIVVAVIVLLHLLSAQRAAEELKLVLVALVIGTVWDSALVMTGWVRFSAGNFANGMAPYWMLAMWALFATTLNVSLLWLRKRWALVVLLGAVGGPMSYWGGARMGAMTIVEPVPITIALALGWAVIMVLLMLAADRFNGFVDKQAKG